MKRWIHAASEAERSGFLMEAGNRAFFLISDGVNLTDKIVRAFINGICDFRGVGDKIRGSALYDRATLQDFRRRIDKAILEKTSYGYKISGNNFSISYPQEDFEQEVIILE